LLQRDAANDVVGTLGLQARVSTERAEGRFDDLLGASCFSVLSVRGAPQRVLSPAQVSKLRSLGAVIAELAPQDAPATDGAVIDVDGRYAQYFAEHGIHAIIIRPDFYVFGVVEQLERLPELVDELLLQLSSGGRRSLSHA
jgi:flavoprotein hydroxylase